MHELAHKICPQCEARVLDEHRFCPSCGSDLSSVSSLDGDPYLGVVIEDRYRIEELLGSGAMGRVYKAEQTALHKPFAIKILSPQLTNDPDSQARFANEAHNCASLNHPNVVSVVDYGRTHDGITYLVMEYIEGRSLEQIIYDEFPLTRERIADLILQVLAALAEAHGLGVLHRDLKPENILVQSLRTRGELLKVLDFGIAKLMDDAPNARARPGLTSQGAVCGTPEYMSPEQACGLKLDQRSDIYAVGVILYQMLTGRPPFESDVAVEILHRHIHEVPKPPSEVLGKTPDPLEAVCLRALAKERDGRYADAAEFREAIVEAARLGHQAQIHCTNCQEQMRPVDRYCPACGIPAPDQHAITPNWRVERRSTRALRQATGEATAEVLLRALPSRLAGEAWAAVLAAAERQLQYPKPGLMTQVIAGGSGAGKSRLLDELCDRAEQHGWRVLQTGCEPTGAMTALWPIRVAVSSLLAVDHRSATPGEINRAANLIGLSYEALPGMQELFGVGVGAGVGANAIEYAVRRRECFTSAVQALTEVSGRPLVLVFDDVDRWDAPSRRVLQQLVRARSEHPILLLVATAEEKRDWLHSPVVALPRLGPTEIEAWAEGLSKSKSALPARLASHAPMTPFELELAVRSLPAAGQTVDVVDAINAWLGNLAANERQVIELASLLGERMTLDDVDALRETDPLGQPGDLRRHLNALVHAGLLTAVDGRTWEFRSRRICEHIPTTMDRNRARHLHREAAIRTESAQLSPTVRALHLLRAQPSRVRDTPGRVQTVELIEALREAAVTAIASFDDPKAVRLLRTALKACRRLADEDRLQHEAHLIAELIDPFCFTDRVDEAIDTLRKVLGTGQAPELESEMHRALGRCLSRKRDWKGAIDAYQRALGPLIAQGRRPALLELYADLAGAYASAGQLTRGIKELSEGLDMCTLGDGPRAIIDVSMWRYLLAAADLHERSGDSLKARTWAEHALFQAERRNENLGVMRCHEFLGRLLRALDQAMLAEQHVGRGLELARKIGDRRTSAEFLLLRASLRVDGDRPDDARRCLDEALRLSELLEWERGSKRAREGLAALPRE
ncbi:serine/threonine-protein kinase [Enhygromyxa salina]|uniref:non-specific serine/threonine protein kinase n=1 Tax=Enhygromyxa salina TaxID=215803 RepID=A0A2S9YT06_9BACT|nr:serine/threonine-protein kinase [Enhygromyxa salina]PRQ08237.1 Serine/threonine-protein kinase PknB [Enhygromyxa salina]